MSDCMHFPDTVEEFMEQYKMTDTKQVYSNGTEYVPIFRMKQWFEHEKAQLSQEGTTFALNNQVNLCDSCTYTYPECPSEKDDVIFGNGIGNDNICACNKYQPTIQPEQQHGRIFREIVVEYPSYNTYPEYKGKPYFSIKYTKNGQEFIGYGTYKPEVLSEYLKEYFMPSAQPERAEGEWVDGRCNKCGGHAPFWCMASTYHESNYCPNCGAKMTILIK